MALSIASRALDALLEEDSPEAAAVRKVAHRTALWNYRTGRRKPDADTIGKLHEASNGRIPAEGWRDDEDEPAEESRQ
jgi:hypothetical protein